MQPGGRANGPSRGPFDRWFRYPAGFSPDALKAAMDAACLEDGDLVVDPFAGAATGWRAGIARGYRYAGLEAHPEIAELAHLKLRHLAVPQRIVEDAKQIVQRIDSADVSSETDLVKRSFTRESLQQLVSIRDQLKNSPDQVTSPYLKWCLLGSLRDCATVQVRWPYQRPGVPRQPRIADPKRAFMRRSEWMRIDLVASSKRTKSTVRQGDARRTADWDKLLGGEVASTVISSPPYLNNFDYADATRLELYFWGVVANWSEMVSRIRAEMLTATTQQSGRDQARNAMMHLSSLVPQTASRLESIIERLVIERKKRDRGKEYDRVVGPYFEAMYHALGNMRDYVKPGATVVLVVGDSAPYGVHVDTPMLLGELAIELGLELQELTTIRHRGTRWLSNGLRHQHPLIEGLVVLRRPSQ